MDVLSTVTAYINVVCALDPESAAIIQGWPVVRLGLPCTGPDLDCPDIIPGVQGETRITKAEDTTASPLPPPPPWWNSHIYFLSFGDHFALNFLVAIIAIHKIYNIKSPLTRIFAVSILYRNRKYICKHHQMKHKSMYFTF